jgi:hypothetical protein
MGRIQHLSLESLVKIDHFQKEPPLNLKVTTGAQGVERGQYLKEQIGNPSQIECPLWVKSRHLPVHHPMSALPPESGH